MNHQTVLVLDFGGQYNQLIARRVRECGVYCEVHPFYKAAEKIAALRPIGIIFTGGPNSVYEKNAPTVDPSIFLMGIPILGLCYGCQLMAHLLGGTVSGAPNKEFGKTRARFSSSSPLFDGLPEESIVWMSHNDFVSHLPLGFWSTGTTASCPAAAMEDPSRRLYGLQFHPEVLHTEQGGQMLKKFLFSVCGANGDWNMGNYAKSAIAGVREKVGDGKVLLALSGGVDSSVAALLLEKAVGSQLTCIFVDHGLMRKDEGDQVEAAFSGTKLNFVRVNAAERFLHKLSGVTDPEKKREDHRGRVYPGIRG